MTTFLKRTFFLTFGLVLMIMVSACGSTSTTTGSTPSATATTAPASTPTPAASTSAVQTATATVAGKSETILTDAKGMTLYYFTPDSPTTVACTGGCQTNWPPLAAASGSSTPLADAPLTGKLTALTASGNQVEYNGHPLYTYISDTAPGDIKGQGVGGKWFVATSGLAAA